MKSGPMRTIFVTLALAMTACDPFTSVRVSIRIRPSVVQAYRGGYPAELLVSEPTSSGAAGYSYLGTLCSAEDAKATFTMGVGGVTCADETWVEAWILPAPSGSRQVCGPAQQTGRYLEQPPPIPPVGRALLMKGVHHVCGNYQSTESFEIGTP